MDTKIPITYEQKLEPHKVAADIQQEVKDLGGRLTYNLE